MKKLSVVMAVVLGLALVFSVVGMAGEDVLCKATGGAQIDYTGSDIFTFNATVYEGGTAKGMATWVDHDYGKLKLDVIGGACIDENSVMFETVVIASSIYLVNEGQILSFTVTDGGKSGVDEVQAWGDTLELQGGNIVVRSYVVEPL